MSTKQINRRQLFINKEMESITILISTDMCYKDTGNPNFTTFRQKCLDLIFRLPNVQLDFFLFLVKQIIFQGKHVKTFKHDALLKKAKKQCYHITSEYEFRSVLWYLNELTLIEIL